MEEYGESRELVKRNQFSFSNLLFKFLDIIVNKSTNTTAPTNNGQLCVKDAPRTINTKLPKIFVRNVASIKSLNLSVLTNPDA